MVTARRRYTFWESRCLPPLLLPPGRQARLPLPLRNSRLRAAGGENGQPTLSVRPGISFFPLALLLFARALSFSPAHPSTFLSSATPSPSTNRPRGHGSPPAGSEVTCLRRTAFELFHALDGCSGWQVLHRRPPHDDLPKGMQSRGDGSNDDELSRSPTCSSTTSAPP